MCSEDVERAFGIIGLAYERPTPTILLGVDNVEPDDGSDEPIYDGDYFRSSGIDLRYGIDLPI